MSGQQQEMQSFKTIIGCFTLYDRMIKAEVGKLYYVLPLATISLFEEPYLWYVLTGNYSAVQGTFPSLLVDYDMILGNVKCILWYLGYVLY